MRDGKSSVNPLDAGILPPGLSRRAKCRVITPYGEGGIGVILVYGEGALSVLEACFRGSRRSAARIAPGTMAHGMIMEGDAVIDEVVAANMSGRQCGARCACYEVNCHGGPAAVNAVFRRLCSEGAEAVDRGEEGGLCWGAAAGDDGYRLSAGSIRTCALSALERALTRPAVRMLLNQAGGALYGELVQIAESLGGVDAGEGERRLQALLSDARGAMAMLEPPGVMITGPPNAGKSTLLNALLGRERVIVHPAPGATRDVVRDRISIEGMPFDIMDSAGVHGGGDALERLAVKNTLRTLGKSDIILAVFDVRDDPAEFLRAAMPAFSGTAAVLYVANKCDLLGGARPHARGLPCGAQVAYISAVEGSGIEKIERFLTAPFGGITERCRSAGPVLFTAEQCRAAEGAMRALKENGAAAAAAALVREGVHPGL